MPTTKLCADWLEATLVAGLGVSVAKGAAAWDRPALGASNGYIEWRSDTPAYDQRTGHALDGGACLFDVVIVSTNEVALWSLIDLARTTARAYTRATIDNQTMRIRFGAWERLERTDETPDALRYAAVATVTMQY